MFKITNSNNGQQTTCQSVAHVKRILRNIVKGYGGRQSLKGIYIEDPNGGMWYAEDMQL